MLDERRFIVRGSQGGVDDSPPESGGQPGGTQPESPKSSGEAPPAGGHRNSGHSDPESSDLTKAIWAEARKKYGHWEQAAKDAQKERDDYRKRLAKHEAELKSAEEWQNENEQLRSELTKVRGIEDQRLGTVAKFAEDRKKALPEHLRDILAASAGDDPIKALDLLPKFEDLARRTSLKTIGGNSGGGNAPQIDFEGIRAAQARGDTRPLQEAHAKHGQKVYNEGLQKWLAERGR